jgi:DNA invertase Pin-like site-specific DNA recombinase
MLKHICKCAIYTLVKLAAFLRVSTDRQAEHGQGLDVQRAAIKEWARSNGHQVVLWATDEGQSGSNGLDTREGLFDAVTAIQDGTAEGLIVYKLDRLARDLVLQETLLGMVAKADGRVFSTFASEDALLDPNGEEDSPDRAMIRQILGAVAQYELRGTR